MYRILIVEDDLTIAEAAAKHLRKWGYLVEYVVEFEDVLSKFLDYDPQLVLLDISLPFCNGYHWCGEIRKRSHVPILFLSSASENMNIVMAMDLGADDFMAKPFDLSVLSAKVGALLRRAYSLSGQMNIMEHDGVMLNLNDVTLSYEGLRLELTKNEFRILQILFENIGKAVSRDAIMLRLWESDEFIDDNTLTVNMARLRKKLESARLSGFVKTKKGFGYMVG